MKILIRSPNWIGDQVLAYPFFYYLRQLYPDAFIKVACMPWVESIQFHHLIDAVFILPHFINASHPLSQKTLWLKIKMLENAALTLRNEGPWDLGVALPPSFSSAWLLYRAGVKKRRGYGADGRGFLLNEKLKFPIETPFSRKIHRAESYVRLLLSGEASWLNVLEFWDLPAANGLELEVSGVLSHFHAERAWPHAVPMEPPSEPYWILAPGSMAESRRWMGSRFGELARKIVDKTGWTGVILGGPAEATFAKSLVKDPSLKLLNWTDRASVASYWKVFRGARICVSNDSGLAHIASLCGCPVQMLWGAGDPKVTRPLGPGHVQIAMHPVDCWPCEKNSCMQVGEKKLECLKGIEVDSVFKDIESLLQIAARGA